MYGLAKYLPLYSAGGRSPQTLYTHPTYKLWLRYWPANCYIFIITYLHVAALWLLCFWLIKYSFTHLLHPPGGIVITRVYWFETLNWFVIHSLRFLENYKSDLHKIWHRCSPSVPANFTFNFSGVKAKVRGQNRRAENLPIVIARLWF